MSCFVSACTFNVSTGTNNATAPNSNAANDKTSANQPANNTATVAKKEEAPKKTDSSPSSSNSNAKSERVQFKSGETSTMLTRDIPANGSIDFIMDVQKGQTIGYTVGYDFDDGDIEAFLTEPGMQDISKSSGPKEPQEFVVKKSGDHRLTVNNTTKKKITMTLYLDIE